MTYEAESKAVQRGMRRDQKRRKRIGMSGAGLRVVWRRTVSQSAQAQKSVRP